MGDLYNAKFRTSSLERQVVLYAALRLQVEAHERGDVEHTEEFLRHARKMVEDLTTLIERRKRNVDATVARLSGKKTHPSE